MPEDRIAISDLHLAAFLLTKGFPLLGVEGSPGRREFLFPKVPPEVITSFYGGDDQVSARTLLDALRNLRGLLAQGGR